MADEFAVAPLDFVSGSAMPKAIGHLCSYFGSYTGSWFQTLADAASPNDITEKDLVAVTMLSVKVPATAAIWLQHQGRENVKKLLAAVGDDLDIWNAPQSQIKGALEVYAALREDAWGPEEKARRIGPVTASKLVAAKRPRLVPVWDREVHAALRPLNDQYWLTMWDYCQSDDGKRLRSVLGEVKDTALKEISPDGSERANLQNASLLRILDIAVWMEVYGSRPDLAAHEGMD